MQAVCEREMTAEFSCRWCARDVLNPTKSQRDKERIHGRIYCSKECSNAYRSARSSITMKATNKKHAAARMKLKNPMHSAETRRKMAGTLKRIGHKPKIRGGNGSGLTLPQNLLMDALKIHRPIAEMSIPTLATRGNHEGWSTHYKIDVAIPDYKIAIEIDGGSHGSLIRQEQDYRKTCFLYSKGWRVIRFKNAEIVIDPSACAERVLALVE